MDVNQDPVVPEEQLAYARWLAWGTHFGLALLTASACVYLLGLVQPYVPFERLATVWTLPVDEYRIAVGAPAGWGWLGLAARADYLNYTGIGFLSGITGLCYLRIVPILLARGERAYALIAAVEILVLAVAAAGIVGPAH